MLAAEMNDALLPEGLCRGFFAMGTDQGIQHPLVFQLVADDESQQNHREKDDRDEWFDQEDGGASHPEPKRWRLIGRSEIVHAGHHRIRLHTCDSNITSV
jgi:hypothetical protein